MKINPFKVEKNRNELAQQGKFDELKKTYSSNYPEIRNLNTSQFWDAKFETHENLNQQDGMTQDRVKAAYNFIPEDEKRILDIGAGNGYIEELISKRKNIELYANDISEYAIKNLKKRFKGELSVESLYKMNYPKNFFDVVLALEVLEHIPPSKILKVLRNIKSIITINGYFIVSIPINEGLEKMRENPSGHVRIYTQELIKRELEISGFKVLKIKHFYAFKKLYSLKKFLVQITRNKWKPNNLVILAQSI